MKGKTHSVWWNNTGLFPDTSTKATKTQLGSTLASHTTDPSTFLGTEKERCLVLQRAIQKNALGRRRFTALTASNRSLGAKRTVKMSSLQTTGLTSPLPSPEAMSHPGIPRHQNNLIEKYSQIRQSSTADAQSLGQVLVSASQVQTAQAFIDSHTGIAIMASSCSRPHCPVLIWTRSLWWFPVCAISSQ